MKEVFNSRQEIGTKEIIFHLIFGRSFLLLTTLISSFIFPFIFLWLPDSLLQPPGSLMKNIWRWLQRLSSWGWWLWKKNCIAKNASSLLLLFIIINASFSSLPLPLPLHSLTLNRLLVDDGRTLKVWLLARRSCIHLQRSMKGVREGDNWWTGSLLYPQEAVNENFHRDDDALTVDVLLQFLFFLILIKVNNKNHMMSRLFHGRLFSSDQ